MVERGWNQVFRHHQAAVGACDVEQTTMATAKGLGIFPPSAAGISAPSVSAMP
jgi:hypothetical protein